MKYAKYKSSEVESLGEIPEHWEVKRIKNIFSLERGKFSHRPRNDERMYDAGTYPFIQTGDVAKSDKYITQYKQVLNENGIKVSRKFKRGTLLMTIAANVGDVAILDYDAYLPDSIIAFISKQNILYYYYVMSISKSELDTLKITNTQDNLNLERLNSILKIYPPIIEQDLIAEYLDSKTQVIDKKIDLLNKKAIAYKELRKSIINNAVSKGLVKNVKLKKSAVNFINEIPENWTINRIKDNFDLFTGNSISDKELFENCENSLDYVSTKDIDFETGKINYNNGIFIPKENKTFKVAKANSTLICIEGASAGKKIGFTVKEICFVNKLCAVKSKTKLNFDKYLFYQFQSEVFEKQFFSILNGLIGGVSLNSIKYFEIISPPIMEQEAIANYLDEKTRKIDTIVSNIKQQIATLKELRKTLINDVVTGKIKVLPN